LAPSSVKARARVKADVSAEKIPDDVKRILYGKFFRIEPRQGKTKHNAIHSSELIHQSEVLGR